MIHHSSRRFVHFNVTDHPTSAWTLQQLGEAVGCEDSYRYLIHDHDNIFANSLDESIASLGMTVLKSPLQSPGGNAFCERVIATICRERLDWLIRVAESHLRLILRSWIGHYNRGRPHMSLGPGVPDPPTMHAASTRSAGRERRGLGHPVTASSDSAQRSGGARPRNVTQLILSSIHRGGAHNGMSAHVTFSVFGR